MRPLCLPLCLLLPATLAQAQPPGLPGTATPQPYAQPQIRTLPAAPRSSPPLQVRPGQSSPHSPLLAPQPAAQDKPLPALETRRRSQERHPAESAERP